MASQARHQMGAPKELCAPRKVVPEEREKRIPSQSILLAFELDVVCEKGAIKNCKWLQ
jgi:hypothetical protein